MKDILDIITANLDAYSESGQKYLATLDVQDLALHREYERLLKENAIFYIAYLLETLKQQRDYHYDSM